jgi:flagellar hook-associated protein 3 FlgL
VNEDAEKDDMAVTAINLARVSDNLRAFNLLEALRQNQTALYRVQTSLSTGLRFQQPSEDPLGAASAASLDRRLSWMNQVKSNLGKVNSTLTEVDTAMQEALDLLSEAQSLAVQATGDSISSEERQSLATVADSLIDRLVTVANRKHLNTYLFSGLQTTTPFERTGDGVVYHGDAGRMLSMVDTDLTQDSFTISGQDFFGAVSSAVQGVDLDPAVTRDTRLSDLNGARGQGIQSGRIRVTTNGGTVEIDLRGAATVGDVLDRLTAELPPDLTVQLGVRGFVFQSVGAPGPVGITEVGGGHTAADLGLAGQYSGPPVGVDLDPRLTPQTRIADLKAGAGLDLTAGLTISNGSQTATIDLSGAETIEDVLNRINMAGVGVRAAISADGRSLTVQNCVSGSDLSIGENGGSAASALGIRSLSASTLLSALNDGEGVQTEPGGDLRITTSSGATIDVSFAGCTTLQNVLDRLNAAGGGAITAGWVSTGNGLLITDNTTGSGTFRVQALNGSEALADLGLDGAVTGKQLVGRDVNPVRVASPFTALLELKAGMQSDDRKALTLAGQHLDAILKHMQQEQGKMASRAKIMDDRADRVDTEVTATQSMLSDVRDVDFAEAAVRFQQLQMALQANLSTAGQVLSLSVLNYLH